MMLTTETFLMSMGDREFTITVFNTHSKAKSSSAITAAQRGRAGAPGCLPITVTKLFMMMPTSMGESSPRHFPIPFSDQERLLDHYRLGSG